MAEAAAAEETPLLGNLPDEIVLWEILVRLDPKSLLRCRAVRRAWRSATSTRLFLLAHHARQPTLPIVYGEVDHIILVFDHRAAADAQLHTVARLAGPFMLQVSCDGLFVYSKTGYPTRRRLSVCNPVTREHAPVGSLLDFNVLGMYRHRPTGEYRLLLQPEAERQAQTGFYVFPLGSDEPPRYIGGSGTKLASASFSAPAQLRDSLHWYPYYKDEAERELVITFNTIAESFRQMRAPVVTAEEESSIFEVDGTLGMYIGYEATKIVDIWMLPNHESEVWDLKYRVELPMAEIRGKFEEIEGDDYWYVTVVSVDGEVLLLAGFQNWMFYVGTDGKLVASFEDFYDLNFRLKQTLVPHDFFMTPEGCVHDSPFI